MDLPQGLPMSTKASALVDERLQEAASFVRGSDYTGARERVRFARSELAGLVASHEASEGEAEELGADIELELLRYDRLLAEWQRQNEARHARYLTRERAVIEPS
jgi:hypothetical protein